MPGLAIAQRRTAGRVVTGLPLGCTLNHIQNQPEQPAVALGTAVVEVVVAAAAATTPAAVRHS